MELWHKRFGVVLVAAFAACGCSHEKVPSKFISTVDLRELAKQSMPVGVTWGDDTPTTTVNGKGLIVNFRGQIETVDPWLRTLKEALVKSILADQGTTSDTATQGADFETPEGIPYRYVAGFAFVYKIESARGKLWAMIFQTEPGTYRVKGKSARKTVRYPYQLSVYVEE